MKDITLYWSTTEKTTWNTSYFAYHKGTLMQILKPVIIFVFI